MNLIKIFVVVFIVVVGFALWVMYGEVEVEKTAPVTLDPRISQSLQTQANVELAERLLQADDVIAQAVESDEKNELIQSLQAQKVEINRSIELLNDNLSNPQERARSQAQLALLLEEYNQTALPLILDQMSEPKA